MASKRLVALYWDDNQLLTATAGKLGGAIQVERVEKVDRSASGQPASIAQQLKSLGLQRGEATVVIGRRGLEMRPIEVPPVPRNELPDIVRFQARSHFSSLGDDWALDFVPLVRDGQAETVLATALSPKAIQELRDEVEPAGLRVKHIVVRPFSTVELIRRHKADRTCLVVNQFVDDIDLTVSVNGYVNLTRCIRVTPPEHEVAEGGDAEEPAPLLEPEEGYSEKIILQEIRRTMASAANQTHPATVDEIVICGESPAKQALANVLRENLQVPVELFRPIDAVKARPAIAQKLSKVDGEFAPLLGSLLQQTSADSHAIDFLNPRRSSQATGSRRKVILGAAAAAVVLLSIGYYFYSQISAKNRQIARLEREYQQLVEQNQGTDELIEQVDLIDEWAQKSIPWIEELYQISERYPVPDKARANHLWATAMSRRVGITITGLLDSAETDARLKRRLLERPYQVVERSAGTEGGNDALNFAYEHELAIDVEAREPVINSLINQGRILNGSVTGETTATDNRVARRPPGEGETKGDRQEDPGSVPARDNGPDAASHGQMGGVPDEQKTKADRKERAAEPNDSDPATDVEQGAGDVVARDNQ